MSANVAKPDVDAAVRDLMLSHDHEHTISVSRQKYEAIVRCKGAEWFSRHNDRLYAANKTLRFVPREAVTP